MGDTAGNKKRKEKEDGMESVDRNDNGNARSGQTYTNMQVKQSGLFGGEGTVSILEGWGGRGLAAGSAKGCDRGSDLDGGAPEETPGGKRNDEMKREGTKGVQQQTL